MSDSVIERDGTNLANTVQPRAAEQPILVAAKGGGITFVGKLVTLASRFVLAFLLARLLGAEHYGLYNLAVSAIWIASGLALLGLDTALVRYVAVYAHRRDERGLWGALQLSLGVTTVLSILIAIALYAFSDRIAAQRFNEPSLGPLLRLASLILPFLTLSAVAGSATQGFKKMQYAAIARDIIQPLIRLALTVLLIFVGLNATGAVLILGLAVATSAIMLLFFLNKLFALKRPLRTARYDVGEIFRFSLSVYLTDVMILFRENIQTLLLGTLNTITNVGRFAVANQLNLAGSMFQGSITTASRPLIAELYDRKDWKQLRHMYQTASKWMFTFNLPLFLVLVLFPAPILSIFGKSFIGGSTALVLLTWANMVDVATGMCGAVIDMTGYAKLKLINAIVQLVLSLGLSILLIPQWGILGAAVAALIGECTINALRLVEVFILFRLIPYNASFAKPLAAGAAGLAVALGIDYLLPSATNYLYAGVSSTMLLVVYVGMIVLLGLSPDDRTILARARKRLLGRGPRRQTEGR